MAKVRNKYKVQKYLWRNFGYDQARYVFNHVYGTMRAGQEMLTHPAHLMEKKEVWKTTCWNAACEAAFAVRYWIDGNGTKT